MDSEKRIKKASGEHPYTMIANKAINDPRLSLKAKGIIAYIVGKPEGWRAVLRDIVNNSKEGTDAVRSGIKELKKYGYAIEKYTRNDAGQFTDRWVEISDFPEWENTPAGQIPDQQKPQSGESNTNKKEGNKKESRKKEHSTGPDLFDVDMDKKTLFRNSPAHDVNIWTSGLEKYAGVDLAYYRERVLNWSNTKPGVKRDAKGWISTGANFMASDESDGKLRLLPGVTKAPADGMSMREFMDQ